MGRRSKEGCVFPMVIFSEFRTGSGSSMIFIFHVPLLAIMSKILNLAYGWVTLETIIIANTHLTVFQFISYLLFQLVAAFLFMIMVVGNKCFLKKRQTKEEEKCLQKTSYAANITIVIFSLLAGRGFKTTENIGEIQ